MQNVDEHTYIKINIFYEVSTPFLVKENITFFIFNKYIHIGVFYLFIKVIME